MAYDAVIAYQSIKEKSEQTDLEVLEGLKERIKVLNSIQRLHPSTLWDLDVCIAAAIAKVKLQRNG